MNQLTNSSEVTPASYERDFALWIAQQLELLRTRQFEQLDLDNLIEELDDMAKNQQRELRSRLHVLQMHLLKCQFQPELRSRSWLSTIRTQRIELEHLLAHSPSLARFIDAYARDAYPGAAEIAAIETGLPLTAFPTESPYTTTQLRAPESQESHMGNSGKPSRGAI